jgi:hypothetical protein
LPISYLANRTVEDGYQVNRITIGSRLAARPIAPGSWFSGTNSAERDRLPYDISEPNGAAIINQTPHRGVAETSAAKPPLIAIPINGPSASARRHNNAARLIAAR